MRSMSRIYNLNDPGWGRNGDKSGDQPPRRPESKPDGPPDLDEVWRDFNKRLGSMFGRKPGRGNPPPGGGGSGPTMPRLPKGSPKIVLGGAIAVVGLWLASGFVIVEEGQVAVVTRFGQYTKTLAPGLQWRLPAPIEAHEAVNIAQLRTFEIGYRGSSRNKVLPESLMLTADESIVDVQFVVQYRLQPTGAPDYIFNTNQPDEAVRQAAETAMREIVGRKPMDFVLYSGRTEVAQEVHRLAQSILERYRTGIEISTVAIQNVQPPEQVQDAFDDAVKAGQDRERQVNEGNAYANKVLPEAQGQIARMLEEAEGFRATVVGDARGDTARFTSVENEYIKAPGVMRDRLYLSTMQEILESSSKVMVDVPTGNNMLYLPLDKIASQVARQPQQPSSGNSSNSVSSAAGAGAAAATTSSSNNGSTPSVPSSLGNSLANPYSPYAR
ncbi:FtsH protease activity modulator HflK [Paenalcaligenes niemegkensis]|uniref:FtsH protease activity modulator HflK n=1 Tax=Paenalcaligenes niemegkensis TaxID=2895469 RepID=UPI001EE900C2|nr:FtsH protease activity modulator HflK [Paenalcaligenes niemegkensis]MCQ9616724.1 FtsH protease activity modulator HflK [Paenalcaligenes niemegkensis]